MIVTDRLANRIRITKWYFDSLMRQGRNSQGNNKGIKTWLYGCSTPREFCTGSPNIKIRGAVTCHGSPEDAMRCMKRFAQRETT